jgi:hypothetical protein
MDPETTEVKATHERAEDLSRAFAVVLETEKIKSKNNQNGAQFA